MQKRGQLTANQIIMLVLILVSLAILIVAGIAIYELYSKSSPDEVCRLSILEKATVPSAAQTYIPLKCFTKKICLTLGDNNCEKEFLGEANIDYLKLPLDNKDAVEKIEETMANAQYDCWSLTGKGNLDISSGINKNLLNFAKDKFEIEKVKPSCLICSRIALSKDLQETQVGRAILLQVNVLDYMKTKNVPGSSLTYLQTFTDKQVTDYPMEQDFRKQLESRPEHKTTQIAYVFTQVLSNDNTPNEQALDAARNTGIAVGTGLLTTPAGKVFGLSGGIIWTIASMSIAGGLAWNQATENQAVVAAHCGMLTTTAKKEQTYGYGCSFVTPVDYNSVTKVNKLCAGGILGSP